MFARPREVPFPELKNLLETVRSTCIEDNRTVCKVSGFLLGTQRHRNEIENNTEIKISLNNDNISLNNSTVQYPYSTSRDYSVQRSCLLSSVRSAGLLHRGNLTQ